MRRLASFHSLQSRLTLTIDEKGISAKFLSYVQDLDKTAGERALGPNQTVSSKVQDTLASAHQQAKNLDEQKGISKTFYDVCRATSFRQIPPALTIPPCTVPGKGTGVAVGPKG